jgi:type I site-specific restriction endonuclease
MSGKDEAYNPKPYFGEYPTDYFDFIIIDARHKGLKNRKEDTAIGRIFSSLFNLFGFDTNHCILRKSRKRIKRLIG